MLHSKQKKAYNSDYSQKRMLQYTKENQLCSKTSVWCWECSQNSSVLLWVPFHQYPTPFALDHIHFYMGLVWFFFGKYFTGDKHSFQCNLQPVQQTRPISPDYGWTLPGVIHITSMFVRRFIKNKCNPGLYHCFLHGFIIDSLIGEQCFQPLKRY